MNEMKTIKKEFTSDVKEWTSVSEFLETNLQTDIKTLNKILIVAEEIFVNQASYAYKDSSGEIDITINQNDCMIQLQFEDNGVEFNPLIQQKPDIAADFKVRSIGGLGIFMAKQMSSNIEYKYEDGKNVLVIDFML